MSSTKCGAVVYVTSLSQHTLVQHTHHTQISSFYNLTMYNFKQVLTPGVLLLTDWGIVDTFYGWWSGLTGRAEVLVCCYCHKLEDNYVWSRISCEYCTCQFGVCCY